MPKYPKILAIAIAGALASSGCTSEPRAAAVAAMDTATIDPGVSAPDTISISALPDTLKAVEGTLEPTPAPRETSPRPSRPVAAIMVPDEPVQVVFGRAEIEVSTKRFVAAEYLRVNLMGGRQPFETVTNRNGEFFFERVPPGKYDLVFLTAKEDRKIYTVPVVVGRVPKLQLSDVHIPLGAVPQSPY